jgi:hypothetical protein
MKRMVREERREEIKGCMEGVSLICTYCMHGRSVEITFLVDGHQYGYVGSMLAGCIQVHDARFFRWPACIIAYVFAIPCLDRPILYKNRTREVEL